MYKKSNRIICIGLMFCMTSAMILGGCGQKSDSSGKIEIELVQYKPEAVKTFEKIEEEFNATHNDIHLTIESPNDAMTVLKTRFIREDAPDIIGIGGDVNFSNFIDSDMLMDISDYEGLDSIKQAYLDIDKALEFVPEDGVYAVPYVANAAGELSICTITINGIYELLNTKSVIDIIMIFLVTASTYAVTKPLIASQKEYTALKKKFNELIYDENIIQYLFQQELHLTDIDEVSKLSIGNTNAETCLTVVFSPICVSCIKELQILMRILQRKDNIKLDLIFLLDKKKHPESLIIAKHLLSDYQKSPEQFITILQKYVDDYPISKNKIMQDTKFLQEAPQYDSYLNAQEKWCRNHKLYSTPILFINGNKLPNYYNIKDIDYLYS